MPTALVTGATGCVGSALVLRLAGDGFHVRILRRATSDTGILGGVTTEEFVGDICDDAALRRAAEGCDVVFHTAALVSFARGVRDEQRRVNVLGTRSVVRACLAAGVPTLVHTSSVTTVGFPSPGEFADEDTPVDRRNAEGYKLTKILAEDEVQEGVVRGLRGVIVNPSVIMGERDIRFHAGQLIRDVKKGRIPFYIDGGMNIVYAGDVAKGMLLAAEKGRTGERYILGGENLTHREILMTTARLVHGRKPIFKLPLPLLRTLGRVVESVSGILGITPLLTADLAAIGGRYNWYSSDKAVRELGYSARSFEATVLATYRWYHENGYL